MQLDNGLGLFHAFEVANAPTQPGNESGQAPETTGKPGLPPEASDLPGPANRPAAEKSTSDNKDSDKRAALHPAALSPVFLAALLGPIDRVRRKNDLPASPAVVGNLTPPALCRWTKRLAATGPPARL